MFRTIMLKNILNYSNYIPKRPLLIIEYKFLNEKFHIPLKSFYK